MVAAAVLLIQTTANEVANVVTTQPVAVDDQNPTPPNPVMVFDDKTRIGLTLIGALCGAFVSVAIYPGKHQAEYKERAFAIKFGASAIGGVVLTPRALHYLGWEINADNLVTISFFMATVSVSFLATVLPMLEKRAVDGVKNKIDVIP